jgi:tRNA A37 methylthiotransferase MiaB
MTPQKKAPISVGLISLGCAKNLVDSEIMLGSLIQAGLQITNEAPAADVLIVNTCSFIESAQEESTDRGRLPAATFPRRFAQTPAGGGRLHGH